MKQLLSLILSVLLLSQGVLVYGQGEGYYSRPDLSFFSIPRLNKSEVQKQCKFKFNKNICNQYYKYGVTRAQAWDAYYSAYWSHAGEYWQLSPSELYDKYEEIAKDIQYLWNINPEYKDYVLGRRIAIGIIIFDGFVLSTLEGLAVAPLFRRVGTRVVLRNISLKQIFPKLISKLSSGYFWRNLGITFSLMVADTIFIESAFYSLRKTSVELDILAEYSVTPEYAKTKGTLQDDVNIKYAVKSRDLLREIIGLDLTKEEKEELKKNEDEVYNLKQEFKQALKKALEEQGWGSDKVVHRDAVVTLYALEYIRAEMADMADPLRYREAAMDISQIYFSGNLTNLEEDRLGLFNMLDEAHKAAQEEATRRAEKVQEQLDGAVLNMSGGKVGYFRTGMR